MVLLISCKKKAIDPIIPAPVTSIGENYAGGIVVYISQDGQHGLVITDFDVDTCEWSNGATNYVKMNENDFYENFGIPDTEIGAGKYNTQLIVNTFGENGVKYAAKACYNLVHNGYSDWFLPSTGELWTAYYSGVFPSNGLSGNDPNVSESGYYWSSNISNISSDAILSQLHPKPGQSIVESEYPIYGQPNYPHKVRAMREF